MHTPITGSYVSAPVSGGVAAELRLTPSSLARLRRLGIPARLQCRAGSWGHAPAEGLPPPLRQQPGDFPSEVLLGNVREVSVRRVRESPVVDVPDLLELARARLLSQNPHVLQALLAVGPELHGQQLPV